jgi:hypothetical protein
MQLFMSEKFRKKCKELIKKQFMILLYFDSVSTVMILHFSYSLQVWISFLQSKGLQYM